LGRLPLGAGGPYYKIWGKSFLIGVFRCCTAKIVFLAGPSNHSGKYFSEKMHPTPKNIAQMAKFGDKVFLPKMFARAAQLCAF
jgi:hypothetical protein